MHGNNKDMHKAMWQYIIDNVDDILKDYVDDPEDVLIDYKMNFICRVDPGKEISYNCYACQEHAGHCRECEIGRSLGHCAREGSTFNKLLLAIVNGDRNEFIVQAKRIKDAWK